MSFINLKKRVLSTQITNICLGVSLITSLISVLLCYSGFYNLMKRNEIQSHGYNLSLAATSFNNAAAKINDYIRWCESDYDIQSYLTLSLQYDNDSSLKTLFNITSVQTYEKVNTKFFSSISTYTDRIIISTPDGKHYIHIMSQDIPTTYQPAEAVLEQPFFTDLYSAPDLSWGNPENDLFSSTAARQFIPVVRPICDRPGHAVGYLYLEISTDILRDPLVSYPQQSGIPYSGINDKIYTLNGERFDELDTSYAGYTDAGADYLDSNTALMKRNFWEDQILCIHSDISGIQFVQRISQNFFTAYNLKPNLTILTAVFFLIIVSGVINSCILKHLVDTPIKEISQQIRVIGQGNFTQTNEFRYKNELGEIGNGINEMAQKIDQLMTKKIEDEKQRQELEYQILLAQINPHFLFNTLNSIKWMATIQGALGVADMITALSHLMKNISKSNSALIPLKYEFELLNDYFFIQRHRYGGGIKLNIQLKEKELENCLVLRFSLQPIVENALFHGIESKNCQGFISIQASRSENELIISVTDNGIGMSPELIQKSLYEDNMDSKGLFRNIGIYNVNQRIRHTFGENYGISIESREGYYTKVIFHLPCLSELSERNESK